MEATDEILAVWRKFDGFPMETLTKAWYLQKHTEKKQRDVSLMKKHYKQYGITGNCFDLALWLLNEFKIAGIEAYGIGHGLFTPSAHVAVIALGENGEKYLCDLGDQWLQPILVTKDHERFTGERCDGFFPAASVEVEPLGDKVIVRYHRPNGKTSSQQFLLHPIEETVLQEAAEFSQNTLKKKPLLECRIPIEGETAHWEFYDWESFLSTTTGKEYDAPLASLEEWVERIHEKTGYDKGFLEEALTLYKKIG
ncbi:hypothetical protein LCL95_08935 [Bacillus timonensis]|nr:hypothetical protein [Bacillus timonensis]